MFKVYVSCCVLMFVVSCADPEPSFKEVGGVAPEGLDSQSNDTHQIDEDIVNHRGSGSISQNEPGSQGSSETADALGTGEDFGELGRDGNTNAHVDRDIGGYNPTDSNSSERDKPQGLPGDGEIENDEEPESGKDEQQVQKIVARFPLVSEEKHLMHLDVHTAIESIDLMLSHQKVLEKKSFQQVERDWKSHHFLQDSVTLEKEETFIQNEARRVDILLVIDNSKSMKSEQKKLATKLMPLLSKIEQHDWRIAVTTTDPDDACVRDVIHKGVGDIQEKFMAAIQAGIEGTHVEQGFRTAVRALRSTCLSEPWLREQSQLSIIFVSDEDNCSNGPDGCFGEDYGYVSYLLDELARYHSPQYNAKVYGLIWEPSIPKRQCNKAYYRGYQYHQAITMTGGSTGSICADDYTPFLSSVSGDIQSNLDKVYSLSSTPLPESVKVYIHGEILMSGYRVLDGVIEFEEAPPAGSDVRIVYETRRTELSKTFSFPEMIEPEGATVLVNQALMKDGFQLTGQHIEFQDAPVAGSEIRVIYRAPQELSKTFVIGHGVLPESLSIEVSDGSRPHVAYHEEQGTLELTPALLDGVRFEVGFERYQYAPEISYDFQRSGDLEILHAEDHTTGDLLDVRYENGQFFFKVPELVYQHSVTLTYQIQKRGEDQILLADRLILDSITVESGHGHECFDDLWFFIDDVTIDISRCGFLEDDSVSVSFLTMKENPLVFEVEPTTDMNRFQWNVSVDGVDVEFERKGHIFRLLNRPSSHSDVIIQGIDMSSISNL